VVIRNDYESGYNASLKNAVMPEVRAVGKIIIPLVNTA
jgi:hypothetical protein